MIKCNSSEHLLSLIALQLVLIVSGQGRSKGGLLTDWLSLHPVLLSFFFFFPPFQYYSYKLKETLSLRD